MDTIESSDGKPYNPNKEYGICTCAKTGCGKQIRYPVSRGGWRPKYCRAHLLEETIRLDKVGINGRRANEITHTRIDSVTCRSRQGFL